MTVDIVSKLETVDISKEVDIQRNVSANRPLILNFNTTNIESEWGKYTDLDISIQGRFHLISSYFWWNFPRTSALKRPNLARN